MDISYIIYQTIGIVAMLFMVASFQLKSARSIIYMQIFASLFFCIHFYLLGSMMGAFLNFVALIRAYVYSHKEQCNANHTGWLIFFIAIYIGGYITTFTVLGTEPTVKNLIYEMLPVIGMTAGTIGFRMTKASSVRTLSLVNAPAWLLYNILSSGSIGGAVSDSMSMISLIIGKIRLDWKRK
ncbi:MAG: YgjV family protein [Clostridia bacterium]|nr:YgjV family protein [Clostridia bacterium]